MKIAIDLDEVLSEYLKSLLGFYNKKFKTNYTKEDFFSLNFWKVWGNSVEDAKKICKEFHDSDDFKKIKPANGAQEAIKKISSKYKIFIVTARPEKIKELTKEWLRKYFDNFYEKIIFTSDFFKGVKLKSEVCRNLKIKTIIEDHPDYALDCANSDIKVILLDKPWNQDLDKNKNIIRVHNWKEILKELNI